MPRVFESEHFEIVVLDHPHVSRSDGGHLVINPKVPVEDRTQLTAARVVRRFSLTDTRSLFRRHAKHYVVSVIQVGA